MCLSKIELQEVPEITESGHQVYETEKKERVVLVEVKDWENWLDREYIQVYGSNPLRD